MAAVEQVSGPVPDGSARCRVCGRELEPVQVPAHTPVLPVAAVLLGSVLSLYLIGLVLIGVGAWMWTRKRTVLVCLAEHAPSHSATAERAP